MPHPLVPVAILALLLVLLPEQAFAWGPGAHMALGNALLENIGTIAPSLSALLLAHRDAFLYGCLSADIFIGKGVKIKPVHSHNWDTGFRLLDKAGDDRIKAYAYGYLVHLAADVPAHNFYVPNLMDLTPASGRISHVSIEMLADMHIDWDEEQAKQLFRLPNQDADISLLSAMDQRKFLFLIRKQMFRGGLSVFNRGPLNNSLLLMKKTLPQLHNEEYLGSMLQLSLNVAADFLRSPSMAAAPFYDPIGSRNQQLASMSGRKWKKSLFSSSFHTRFDPAPCLANLPAVPAWLMRAPVSTPLRRRIRRFFRKAA